MKKRTIILSFVLVLVYLFLVCTIVFGFMVLKFSQPRYYEKAGWTVTKDVFISKWFLRLIGYSTRIIKKLFVR